MRTHFPSQRARSTYDKLQERIRSLEKSLARKGVGEQLARPAEACSFPLTDHFEQGDSTSRYSQPDPGKLEGGALAAAELESSTPYGIAARTLVDQITGRRGRMSVSDGGQLRWYGATSNRTLSLEGMHMLGRRSQKDLNARCLDALAQGRMDHRLIDPSLEDHLIDMYFAWHDPFFPIIDKDAFYRHRQIYQEGLPDCRFFSLAVFYAILAYSAHLSDEVIAVAGTLPESAGDAFMARAKICLDEEMDSPQETTVQALAIMAAREAGCGRDTRGWVYIGMALNCAIDLGMHTDVVQWLEAGIISDEQYQIRNMTWWGYVSSSSSFTPSRLY
jgi:hypothetical protein